MADIGHELTDELLEELEKRVKEEYEKALADAEKKLSEWLKKFTREDEEKKKLLAAGQITEKEYKDWRFRHIMMGKEWEKMRDTLAADFHHANEIALGIARGKMPDVYALNMNYGTYDIEHGGEIDTGFQLYNHDAAELLMREEHIQLMPGPSTRKAAEIAANKDLQWNQRHIQSAVLQGILLGESPYKVADRLQLVAQMNYNNAVRYARTMTTAAQNAGRYEAFRRADRLGVDLVIEWQATLDQRTRHDHRLMHGQRTEVDEPFHTPDGFLIMWPADCTSGVSTAPQGEIWNCRCTLVSRVKGFEPDTVKYSPKMGDMTFEEWQQAKPMSKEEQDAWIKAGKPSLDEWEKSTIRKMVVNRRADQEQFERYRETLGNLAPKNFTSFQRMKYNNEGKWDDLKRQYRAERTASEKRASEELYSGHLSGDLSQYRDSLGRLGTVSSDLHDQSIQVNYILNQYSDRQSRWSGNTIIAAKDELDSLGRKEWNCDITLREDASVKATVHEHLHARSVSYYNANTFSREKPFEEGAVELYADAICAANSVQYSPTYTKYTGPLRTIGTLSGMFDDEFVFARTLFEIPLPERRGYIDGLANSILSNPDISARRKNKVRKAIIELEGGEKR